MPGVSRPAELFRAIVLLSKWTSIWQLSVQHVCVRSGTGHIAKRFVAVLLVCKWAGNFRFYLYFFDMAMRRTGALECSCTVCPFLPGTGISNISMFGCDMLPRTLTRGKCRCTAIALCKRARESFSWVYRVKVFFERSSEWERCSTAKLLSKWAYVLTVLCPMKIGYIVGKNSVERSILLRLESLFTFALFSVGASKALPSGR